MKTHDRAEWFKTLQDKYRHDPEYIAEGKILDITEKIVARMEELCISRADLAARLNVSKAYITKLLRGNVNFTLKSLIALAAALDADISIDFMPDGVSRRVLQCYDNTTGSVVATTHTVLQQPFLQSEQPCCSDDYTVTPAEAQEGDINASTSAA